MGLELSLGPTFFFSCFFSSHYFHFFFTLLSSLRCFLLHVFFALFTLLGSPFRAAESSSSYWSILLFIGSPPCTVWLSSLCHSTLLFALLGFLLNIALLSSSCCSVLLIMLLCSPFRVVQLSF
jgi:hypothetical protein